MKQTIFRTLVFCAIGAVCILSTPSWAQDGTPGSDEVISWNAASEEPIIEYNEVIGDIADQDTTPRLRVYGDGSVVVHYPVYMKKAGTWTMKLSQEEMAALTQELGNLGMTDFSALQTKMRLRQAEANQRGGTLYYQSEKNLTVINLNLTRVKGLSVEEAENTIVYHGLRSDSKVFQDDKEIANLKEAVSLLNSVAASDKLVKQEVSQ